MGVRQGRDLAAVARPRTQTGLTATRYAILSDIHGNLRALDACLADLQAQGGADAIVGAGDFCLDGPRPREVLERLQSLGATLIRGNTDRYVALEPLGAFEPDEAAQIAWTREQLGDEWLRTLRELPMRVRFDGGLLVVHANPISDDEHVWPDADDATLERFFGGTDAEIVAYGHLHLPYTRVWRGKILVNVASAGIPKDGDPRAGYALLTRRSGGWEVKHRRIDFDVERVVRQLRKSGMPHVKGQIATLRRHRYKQLQERIP